MAGVYFEEPLKAQYMGVWGDYSLKDVYPPLCHMPQRLSANDMQQQFLLFPFMQPYIIL